jgi:hypothetical protein
LSWLLFSSLGPPLELRELALLTRSKSNTSSTLGQIHPETLSSDVRVSGCFAVPENRGTFEARGPRLPRASVLEPPNRNERSLCGNHSRV